MKTFAVISGNIVINTIVANSLEDAQLATNATCIEYTNENPGRVGDTYDGSNFIAPVVAPTE